MTDNKFHDEAIMSDAELDKVAGGTYQNGFVYYLQDGDMFHAVESNVPLTKEQILRVCANPMDHSGFPMDETGKTFVAFIPGIPKENVPEIVESFNRDFVNGCTYIDFAQM